MLHVFSQEQLRNHHYKCDYAIRLLQELETNGTKPDSRSWIAVAKKRLWTCHKIDSQQLQCAWENAHHALEAATKQFDTQNTQRKTIDLCQDASIFAWFAADQTHDLQVIAYRQGKEKTLWDLGDTPYQNDRYLTCIAVQYLSDIRTGKRHMYIPARFIQPKKPKPKKVQIKKETKKTKIKKTKIQKKQMSLFD